jgi:hypothetical protein
MEVVMKKLRFLHIPKTAGSTFRRILKHKYQGKGCFVFKGNNPLDRKRFADLSEGEKKNVALFLGHAPIISGVKEADEIPIITILRDPISRVKSFCQYVSEGKSGYLRNDFPPETFDLDEFLHSNNSELSNLQSRMLINYEKKGSQLLIDTLTLQEIEAKALYNLFNKISWYGLQEYFDESLVRFAIELGCKPPYYEYINRKNRKRLLKYEDRHIKKIVELNTIDISFYNAAKERFINSINTDEHYKQKYRTFKRNQKLVSPVMKLYGETARYVKRKHRAVFGVK